MEIHLIEEDISAELWLEDCVRELEEGIDHLLSRRGEFHDWLVANERL